jgi:UDP-glucose 4-epimerase
MKLLVTGGTGFIGSHFLAAALAAGHEVTALRRTAGAGARVSLPSEPRWLERGLSETSARDLAGFDVLVHFAAAGVSPQRASWDELFRVNVLESSALWQAAVTAGVRRLVVCGSCYEYGRAAEQDRVPSTSRLQPVTPYAASKAAASMALSAIGAAGRIEAVLLRPFSVFGEGQNERCFWPSLRRAAHAGEDFAMSPGRQIRDFISASGVAARFLNACLRSDVAPGSVLVENVGTGRPEVLGDFAARWWREWGARGRLKIGALPYREGEIMRCVAGP